MINHLAIVNRTIEGEGKGEASRTFKIGTIEMPDAISASKICDLILQHRRDLGNISAEPAIRAYLGSRSVILLPEEMEAIAKAYDEYLNYK